MTCDCGNDIPEARVELIEAGKVPACCVHCSGIKPYSGMMVFSHKTAPTIAIIDNNAINASEVHRQADRAYRRAR